MSVIAMVARAMVMVLTLGVGLAWADAKGTVTREESKPKTVELKGGADAHFINATGGTAYVMFTGQDGVKFYIGKGAGRVKFEKPGIYECTVHGSGTKVHAHTGRVVVK
jgi:hypothetical protein